MPRLQENRPLSPHVGIYRWQISNTLSILHRITGFGLSFGLIVFAAWIWSAAYSPDCFDGIAELASTLLGKLFLFGWTAAFYYHFGNGLRHLNWDTGRGLRVDEMTASGWVVVVFTITMTILTWTIVLNKVGL